MTDLLGFTLGRYQLVERLGRGGMADVYKAYQPGLDRYVAVKVMHPHLADQPEFITRFEREARAVARLRHPNIIQVFDFDVQDEWYFMVMEYVEGSHTLKEQLFELSMRGEQLAVPQTLGIMAKVADALDYAHQQGMIHRDIKPSNILMPTLGNPLLSDFGIALLAGLTGLTATSVSIGTPSYMSPEQGQGETATEQSDIYALGIVLYECLAGQPPYDADTPFGVILKHINAPLPLPREVMPDLPEEVERIVLTSLAKNPADRYASAAHMRDALNMAVDQLAVPSIANDVTLVDVPGPAVEPQFFDAPTVVENMDDFKEAPIESVEPDEEEPEQVTEPRQVPKVKVVGIVLVALALLAAAGYFVFIYLGLFSGRTLDVSQDQTILTEQWISDDTPQWVGQASNADIQEEAAETSEPLQPILPTGSEPLQFCMDPQPDFPRGFLVRQDENMSEPEPHIPFRDSIYGGCIVRVTDREQDLAEDDQSDGLKNEYSRIQSFNADETMILVRSIDANYYVYDANSLKVLGQLPAMNEPRWSNQNPHLIFYIGELSLMSFNLSTGEQQLVHDFSGGFPGQDIVMVWTRWEGNPSIDDRYWALMAEDQDWMTVAFIVYDLERDQVISHMAIHPAVDLDSVTMSPLGNYFLAQFEFCEHGSMGSAGRPCGLMVYDRDLNNPRGLLRNVGHSDMTFDANGKEIFFYQDQDSDQVAILDLATGEIKDLFPINFTYCNGCGMHFSGLGYQLPGWGLISYFDADPITRMWMDDHIFAVELKPDGRVVRFAQHHSLVDPNQDHDYWAEPHASVNRDFSRIVFTSNWGRSGTGEVEMYLIKLPENWHTNSP